MFYELGQLIVHVLLAVLLLGLIGLRRWAWSRRKPKPGGTRCKCGYALDHGDTIRCSECGRVSGFDVTAEELELSMEQLQRAKAKRLEHDQHRDVALPPIRKDT